MDEKRISDAEMAILELLWRDSPLTAAEVHERLAAERQWSLATVKTLLSRLVAKRAVASQPDGRRFLYSPAIAKAPVAGQEAGRLVDRLFGGRVSPLVAQLASQGALSDEDLAELEALIQDLKA